MNAMLSKYGEWVYRIILLGSVCIGLYLNSRYVTRTDFDLLASRVVFLDQTLKVMTEQNRVNDRQDQILGDHETRLRTLERNRP